jgi:hypothetical protein
MTDTEAIAALATQLQRINRNLEMIFGIPELDVDSALAKEIQALIDKNKDGLKGIAVWPATDSTGQTHLCVRRGFMQPTTCFPVDDIESARAYLSGVLRSNSIR